MRQPKKKSTGSTKKAKAKVKPKSKGKNKAASDPLKMTWQEIYKEVPQRYIGSFRNMVMQAELNGELSPLARKFPNNPLVLLVKEYLKTKKPSLIKKAVYAATGTDKNAYLILMKS